MATDDVISSVSLGEREDGEKPASGLHELGSIDTHRVGPVVVGRKSVEGRLQRTGAVNRQYYGDECDATLNSKLLRRPTVFASRAEEEQQYMLALQNFYRYRSDAGALLGGTFENTEGENDTSGVVQVLEAGGERRMKGKVGGDDRAEGGGNGEQGRGKREEDEEELGVYCNLPVFGDKTSTINAKYVSKETLSRLSTEELPKDTKGPDYDRYEDNNPTSDIYVKNTRRIRNLSGKSCDSEQIIDVTGHGQQSPDDVDDDDDDAYIDVTIDDEDDVSSDISA